jgi:hypothetical protein
MTSLARHPARAEIELFVNQRRELDSGFAGMTRGRVGAF